MKAREISRSKIGLFSLACTDPYIGIGWEYQSHISVWWQRNQLTLDATSELWFQFLYLHFYIINQISIFIQHLTRLVFWILVIKSNLTEVSEQPRSETPALNVMAIHDQRHANVSKQRTLLEDVDVAPPQVAA